MEQKDWFEDWFDSPYYHILYKNRNEEEAKKFIDNLFELLNLSSNSNILDLACGKGRHSVYIGRKGFNTVGVDLSANSINEARHNKLPNLKFDVHDMRKPYGKNQFDLVLNMFTSFGYFTNNNDNKEVFESVGKSLKESGIFLIDFMNVHRVIAELKEEDLFNIDNIEFKIKRFFDESYLWKEIRFFHKDKEYTFKERVQLLKLEHFRTWANATGFQINHIFGDYDLNGFSSATSERLIMLLRKNN